MPQFEHQITNRDHGLFELEEAGGGRDAPEAAQDLVSARHDPSARLGAEVGAIL